MPGLLRARLNDMATRKDYLLVGLIGLFVGLLSQLILNTLGAKLMAATTMTEGQFRLGVVVFFVLLAPFALWVASLLSRKIPVILQFAKFGAVGSLNSFIDLGVLNLLTWLISANPSQFLFAVFKLTSFLSATTNSYFWNRSWTFESKKKASLKEGAEFYLIAAFNAAINVGVATITRGLLLGANPAEDWQGLVTNLLAPVVGFLAAFIGNFLGYKFIVFKHHKETAVAA